MTPLFSFPYRTYRKNPALPQADVTVILTVWKREHLEMQLQALLAQTVVPAHVWVVHCCDHVSVKKCLKKYPFVEYVHSTIDLKYFVRFSMARHCTSEYVWVLDDDIIPSGCWLEKCIQTCLAYNAIVCSNGRLIPPGDYYPELPKDERHTDKYFIGDSRTLDSVNTCAEDTRVDFGCSSHFFKTAWLQYFWGTAPCTLQTGEDIHLAATCAIAGGIPTVVPRQLSRADSGNVSPALSCDEHASWRRAGFSEQRALILKYFIDEKNWLPTLWTREGILDNLPVQSKVI